MAKRVRESHEPADQGSSHGRTTGLALMMMVALLAKLWFTVEDQSFGPVVERVLPHEVDGIPCVLDFESGDLLLPAGPPSSGDATFRDGALFFSRMGAIVTPGGQKEILREFSSWTVEEAVAGGGAGSNALTDLSGSGIAEPLSTPFVSGDGSQGVLEVRPVWSARGQVIALKIRYKLALTGNGPLEFIRRTRIISSATR